MNTVILRGGATKNLLAAEQRGQILRFAQDDRNRVAS